MTISTQGITRITQKIDLFLYDHPRLYKVAVLIGHIVRTTCMVGMMYLLPFSTPTNCALGILINVGFRLVLERCQFRYSIASGFGASAFIFAKPALAKLCSGVAFASLQATAQACANLVPLALYAITILSLSHDDVENVIRKQKQCTTDCCSTV